VIRLLQRSATHLFAHPACVLDAVGGKIIATLNLDA
jgi:hypothetical protein